VTFSRVTFYSLNALARIKME